MNSGAFGIAESYKPEKDIDNTLTELEMVYGKGFCKKKEEEVKEENIKWYSKGKWEE